MNKNDYEKNKIWNERIRLSNAHSVAYPIAFLNLSKTTKNLLHF